MAEIRRHKGATLEAEERFTTTCERCGWVSYPFLEQSAAILDWSHHNRAEHPHEIDGQEAME